MWQVKDLDLHQHCSQFLKTKIVGAIQGNLEILKDLNGTPGQAILVPNLVLIIVIEVDITVRYSKNNTLEA